MKRESRFAVSLTVSAAEQLTERDHRRDGEGGKNGRDRSRAGREQVIRAVGPAEQRGRHRDRRRRADEPWSSAACDRAAGAEKPRA